MIIFDRNTKELDIPVGLGNLEVNIVTPVSPEIIIESAVTESKAYTDEAIGEAIFSGVTENYYTSAQTDNAIQTAIDGQEFKTINGNSIIGEGNIEIQGGGGATTGEVQTMIDTAIRAETARTENTYLKQEVLNGYATENWVEGKGYVTSAETADFVTSAQTKTQIEGYHYTTSADTAQAIGTAVAAETARTESTYLKQGALNGYATKNWVEGKGYVTSADTADFVTSAQTKTQIEGYHYTTSADTAQAISSSLTEYYTSEQTDEKIQDAVSGIDLSDYYTSAQTDNKISSALTDYYTSGQTNNAITTATQNMVTSTAVNNIWVGTTAQYNAITTKDPNTLYFINNN